jgi:hypothetical protein
VYALGGLGDGRGRRLFVAQPNAAAVVAQGLRAFDEREEATHIGIGGVDGRDDGAHMRVQRGGDALAGRPVAHGRHELYLLIDVFVEHERFLRREVLEEGRRRHVGGLGDLAHADVVEAALVEERERRVGPTGLAAACELARRGVRVRTPRRAGPHRRPRRHPVRGLTRQRPATPNVGGPRRARRHRTADRHRPLPDAGVLPRPRREPVGHVATRSTDPCDLATYLDGVLAHRVDGQRSTAQHGPDRER